MLKFLYYIICPILVGGLMLLCTAASLSEQNNIFKSPVAQVIPKTITLHGDNRIDNYFYLKDKTNPDVMKYMEDENKYTSEMMKDTEKFQADLYNEILARLKETDTSVPDKVDNMFYYTRTEKGKQYRIYCRKKESLEAKEEILLDQNELAKGLPYLEVGVYKVSPDHNLMAYSTDADGSETFILKIKDLLTSKTYTESIPNTEYSFEWANDNKTFFYTTMDLAKRPYKIYKHVLGTDPKNDVLIYHEKDESFNLGLEKTKNKKYLIMTMTSETTTESHYLDADKPDGSFKVIYPRQHEIEYSVENHGDNFLIITNENAKNFKLVQVPVNNIDKKNWKEIIPSTKGSKIDYIDVFNNYLAVFLRENGLPKIRINDYQTDKFYYIDFPEPAYSVWKGKNKDANSTILRFNYTSLITPVSVFDYDMSKKTRELKKQVEVIGYNPALYQSERVMIKACDGTEIPVSMVYKKGMVKNGNNPMYLTGYGSYGISNDPEFSSSALSLIDRGFIYSIAHIRGGEEMGREWYDDGKLLNKKNTFTDFVNCAASLVDQKYTSKDKLVVEGRSAGGLLMGAITNMRPDLFKVVIAGVPFVDVINTMLDSSLPLTVGEYEEWGNPADKKYYDYIRTYSPYDNVEAKSYPNMLITGGLNDPRVSYWEPLKWTAKLRANKTDKNVLILKMKMGQGHGGASGRYDYIKETAFTYAFILDILGINK